MESEKEELELRAKKFLDAMGIEAKSVGQGYKKVGSVTLIAGGIFLAAFLVRKKFFKNKKHKAFYDPSLNRFVVKHPKKESTIVRMIKENINIFLITLIKDRVKVHLNELNKKHEALR